MKKTHITPQDVDVVRTELPCGRIEYVYDPFNPENKEVTVDEIKEILRRYGLPDDVYNFRIYQRAFVHQSFIVRPLSDTAGIQKKSAPAGHIPLRHTSNERMEFLGDGVLEGMIKFYLYRRFPKKGEGFMSKTRIAIVKNKTLGQFARDMGLHQWLLMSRGCEEANMRTNLQQLGKLFEAFLAAVFLDKNKMPINDPDQWFNHYFHSGVGHQMAEIFIENILKTHLYWPTILSMADNVKNQLQERLQKSFKTTPHYIEIDPPLTPEGRRIAGASYHMGIYLCVGQSIHKMDLASAERLEVLCKDLMPAEGEDTPEDSTQIITYLYRHMVTNGGKLLVRLGEASHKLKQDAEEAACSQILRIIGTASREEVLQLDDEEANLDADSEFDA